MLTGTSNLSTETSNKEQTSDTDMWHQPDNNRGDNSQSISHDKDKAASR